MCWYSQQTWMDGWMQGPEFLKLMEHFVNHVRPSHEKKSVGAFRQLRIALISVCNLIFQREWHCVTIIFTTLLT